MELFTQLLQKPALLFEILFWPLLATALIYYANTKEEKAAAGSLISLLSVVGLLNLFR